MDSVPVVAITANVAVNMLGKDSFQEIDIAGITMPITKHNFIVKDVTKLAHTIRWAFQIAREGRPGPVLVDITKDVTAALTDYEPAVPEPFVRSTEYIREQDLQDAVELINNAKKPFILVGGGAVISGADEELREFAEKVHAPVADSLMGKGAYDGRNELYTGMLGMHGTKASNLALIDSDLLITIGARFSDRVTGDAKSFAKRARIIQIDVDAAEINKNVVVDVSVIGDVKEVLKCLNARIEEHRHDEWNDHVKELKEKYPLKYNEEGLTGPYVVEEIYRKTNGEAIIVTEVGQHQMWAAQYYKYPKSRTLLSSGGLGTMGYGLGAAIGAKVANPDKIVINVAGDGCFRMNMNEIATAARYNIPVIQVVVNNHVLGMVRQWQTLFYGKRYSATVLNDAVDFVKLAEAMGAVGMRVTAKEEMGPALEKAIALGRPVVIDCQIDCDDKVFPMVAAGRPLSTVFDQDDLDA